MNRVERFHTLHYTKKNDEIVNAVSSFYFSQKGYRNPKLKMDLEMILPRQKDFDKLKKIFS